MASHASVGLPFALLGVQGWRERLDRPVAATLFVTGVSIIGGAQLVEAASARIEYPGMGSLHAVSGAATMLGMLTGAAGLGIAGAAAVVKRPLPIWARLLIGAGVALVIAFLARLTLVGF